MLKSDKKYEIMTPRKNYKPFKYQWAYDLMKLQQKSHWLPEEVGNLSKDISQFYNSATEQEKHGIKVVLKNFTNNEIIWVQCYWIAKVWPSFPHPEIQGMATTNGATEHIHGESYNLIHEGLGFDTKEFYLSYLKDPHYVDRKKEIEAALDSDDIMESLMTFALIEGVSLFSQFAYLQSFSHANLFNQISDLIEWSQRDENIHLLGTIGIIKELENEGMIFSKNNFTFLCQLFYQQELAIIKEIFSLGAPRSITEIQLIGFIEHRINYVCKLLDFEAPIMKEIDTSVKEWFYKDHSLQINKDFFARRPTEYQKGYNFKGIWG